jgi:ABC-type lipoprotein release transport system permease subunit
MLPNQHLHQHSPAQRRKQRYRHGNHTHSAILLLAVIGILASLLPAIQASNLDPVAALRAE